MKYDCDEVVVHKFYVEFLKGPPYTADYTDDDIEVHIMAKSKEVFEEKIDNILYILKTQGILYNR